MAATFGVRGRELLQELKRSEWLPPYNDDGCRRLIEEINAMYDEVQNSLKALGDRDLDPTTDGGVACGIKVHEQSMLRGKRCMLAYLQHRLERVKQLRWETGPVVPEHLQRLLSGKEVEFFGAYDRALSGYMASFDMDLTADLTPPKELCVEVRVLEDCGEIMTDGGAVHLEAHSTHFLRRSDVEHLIRQGKLQQLDG
eukprot:g5330.t1